MTILLAIVALYVVIGSILTSLVMNQSDVDSILRNEEGMQDEKEIKARKLSIATNIFLQWPRVLYKTYF